MKVSWAIPEIGESEISEVNDTVKSTWITMGDRVEEFEARLSDFVGVDHAIAVTSGTAALDVALKAVGIGPGDEVVVPSMTYIATVNSIRYQHAKPVLADISPDTYTIHPDEVRRKISSSTEAILPIDYGGQCADYDDLKSIAKEHDLKLIADCAESLGASYRGEMAGSIGDVTITSFHAAKMLTTGEGGMVFTDNDELASRARVIRNQGENPDRKYEHILLGHNYRMTDLHAAVGLAQLSRIDEFMETRQGVANYYTEHLAPYAETICLPTPAPNTKHSWFLYPILLENREAVKNYLADQGIETRVTWPIPVHQQPIYRDAYGDESHPIAEQFSDYVLSLPLHNQLREEQLEYVVKHLTHAIDELIDEPCRLE